MLYRSRIWRIILLILTLADIPGARPKLENLRHAIGKATLLNFDEIAFRDHLEEVPMVSDERDVLSSNL